MRIIGDTNIPFLSYRWLAIALSLAVIAVGFGSHFLGRGLLFGIDFVGGTQVTLKFRDTPDLAALRAAVSSLSAGSPLIQRFDEAEKNEILIRVVNPPGEEGDFTRPILELLQAELNDDLGGRFDLNTKGAAELLDLLVAGDPDGVGFDLEARRAHYEPMAEAVLELRKRQGIFASTADLRGISELSGPAGAFLDDAAGAGAFSLLAAENVGPAVGKELKRKAQLAMVFSLVGMLIYIWIRFQLPYAVGAVVALIHDVLITLTALALTAREIDLPTIAAILTLVGYSVNDTVVIFDRVRENLRLHRGEALETVIDRSVNQTLSRTILTSGLTLMVVISLFIFGGDVINTFAFVLLVGLIAGTYSTVFIASPVALAMNGFIVKRREKRRAKGKH
jgi:preprotein translocase subunit SecF